MPKQPKSPAPPEAAIAKLAKLHDDALGLFQAKVRPWMLAMERHDAENGRHVSAARREGMRDDLTNRLHDSAYHTRKLRDGVVDGSLLRQQASNHDEGFPFEPSGALDVTLEVGE